MGYGIYDRHVRTCRSFFLMQIDHFMFQFLLRFFFRKWTLFWSWLAKKKGIPKRRSVSALFGGTSGVALRGPHGDASTHESLHHPDGGKVQKCHSRRWGSPVWASLVMLEQLGKVSKIASRFLEVIWNFSELVLGGELKRKPKKSCCSSILRRIFEQLYLDQAWWTNMSCQFIRVVLLVHTNSRSLLIPFVPHQEQLRQQSLAKTLSIS